MSTPEQLAENAKAWPFDEARRLQKRLRGELPAKGYVLFETGYGPSGLPHIGTFGEVARTTMVRQAYETLTGHATKLIAFSDDMDGLRKVPGNVPNADMLEAHLEKPLTQIPDPFGTHESFAHHNNARLRSFLDEFGFDYEFLSSTECYQSGRFDETLLAMLRHYDDVMSIILPTLGPERRATYSPFLPVSPKTGKVLQVPSLERDAAAGTLVFEDEDGSKFETPVTGGHCKMQWKADWAMRWVALDVDYEMAGKDLSESVSLSSKIVKALGARPPAGLSYELFLDETGAKISKSKGNEAITVDSWLRYAAPETLSLYMFQKPKTAKRLYFDVIPKAVDEYGTFLDKFADQDTSDQVDNPVWHIHHGKPPEHDVRISFALLLNLVSASNSEDKDVLWGFIKQYDPHADPKVHVWLDRMVGYAVNYYHDFIRPTKKYRAPTDQERAALADLRDRLQYKDNATPEDLQSIVYAVGKDHGFEPLRDWFKAIYEVLLGQQQGPRFGSFIAIYGVGQTAALIDRALSEEGLSAVG